MSSPYSSEESDSEFDSDMSSPAVEPINNVEVSDQEDDDEHLETCPVCSEEFQQEVALECGHLVHRRCIAYAGQDICPICRQGPIQFNVDDQVLFQQRRTQLQQQRVAQEHSDSLALARQLSQAAEPPHNRVRYRFNNQTFQIDLINRWEGVADYQDIMLELNRILMNLNQRVIRFEADTRAWDLVDFVMQMNRMSANTGLSVSQLCSIIENNT